MTEKKLIFISHSKDDEIIANKLCNYLEKEGNGVLKCWFAPRDNSFSEDYRASIPEIIKTCQLMVVILSKSSNVSVAVSKEGGIAEDEKVRILPFKINDIALSPSLTWCLKFIHSINGFQGKPEEYFPKVLKACNNLLDAGNDGNPSAVPFLIKEEKRLGPYMKILLPSIILTALLPISYSIWQDRQKPPYVENKQIQKSDTVKTADPKTSTKVFQPKGLSGEIKTSRPKEKATPEDDGTYDFDGMKFTNPKNNDFVIFHKSGLGKYNFNGSASKITFSGTAKFDGKSSFRITAGDLKGNIYITDDLLEGDFTLLENNFTPIDFKLYKD